MEERKAHSPIHNDCYDTQISGDIRQLSIGQQLNTVVEDSFGDSNGDAPAPMKTDIRGQYNNRIKVNIPKQDQAPTIVFNLNTKNHGTVLQLDPEATKEFLTLGTPNLPIHSNNNVSPPIQSLSSMVHTNILSRDKTIDQSAAKSSTWKMVRPSSGDHAVSSIQSISFDVEDDGNGNKTIGITYPNTNLSQENGLKGKWKKWLIPLKIGALVILIVLIIIVYEQHINNKNSI